MADDAGHQLLRLTIDSITPDYACPSDPATQQKPAHGYFLGVGVRLRPCWPIPLDGDTEVATRKAMCGYGTFPPGERATSAHRPACSALARYCSGAGRRIDQQDRLQAQTGLAAFENPYIDFTPLTNNGRFTIIGRDGATETVDGTGPEAVLCSKDGNGLIYQEVKPGETYQGIVVLDTANTSGTLVWQPVLALGAPRAGWEWTY